MFEASLARSAAVDAFKNLVTSRCDGTNHMEAATALAKAWEETPDAVFVIVRDPMGWHILIGERYDLPAWKGQLPVMISPYCIRDKDGLIWSCRSPR